MVIFLFEDSVNIVLFLQLLELLRFPLSFLKSFAPEHAVSGTLSASVFLSSCEVLCEMCAVFTCGVHVLVWHRNLKTPEQL